MTNTFTNQWAALVIKFRWWIVVASITFALGLASQGKMEFDGDYHAFFSESNPELEAFDALQEKYTKDDNILIALVPKNRDVFTKYNLEAIEYLTAQSWNTPYSTRVDAITNYQHTRAEGDDLFVEDLSYESHLKLDTDIESIKKIALREPLLINRILNKDGSVTAINITVKLPGIDSEKEIPEITTATRNMISEFEIKYPQFKTYVSGTVPLNTAFFESSQKD